MKDHKEEKPNKNQKRLLGLYKLPNKSDWNEGMTEDEKRAFIDSMIKDAEANEKADAEKRKAIDIRNQGDSLVYQTEKLLTELGDKVGDDEKTEIEEAVKVLAPPSIVGGSLKVSPSLSKSNK